MSSKYDSSRTELKEKIIINGKEIDRFKNEEVIRTKDMSIEEYTDKIMHKNFFRARDLHAKILKKENITLYIDKEGSMFHDKFDFFLKYPDDVLLEVIPGKFAKNFEEMKEMFLKDSISIKSVQPDIKSKFQAHATDFSEFLENDEVEEEKKTKGRTKVADNNIQ